MIRKLIQSVGYWPDGLYMAPTYEAMTYDIKTLKSLGFNMLRKHVKVEPALYYAAADELGILIMQDMPCLRPGRSPTEAQKVEFQRQLELLVKQFRSYSSIFAWVSNPDFLLQIPSLRATSTAVQSYNDALAIRGIHLIATTPSRIWDTLTLKESMANLLVHSRSSSTKAGAKAVAGARNGPLPNSCMNSMQPALSTQSVAGLTMAQVILVTTTTTLVQNAVFHGVRLIQTVSASRANLAAPVTMCQLSISGRSSGLSGKSTRLTSC